MAEVTRFNGTALPAGWTAVTPSGSNVVVEHGYVALKSDAGSNFDSTSNAVPGPEGPYIAMTVSGSFDLAVALAATVNAAPSQGFDLMALGAGTDNIRFAQYATVSPIRSPNWYVYRRQSGSGARQSETNPPSNLYGPWNWMRLTYDDATGTFTCRVSHTGKSDWHTISQFTSTITPVSFAMHATATGPDAYAREQRIAAVVDMVARGSDDATIDPPEFSRVTVLDADFSGSSLPAGLTASEFVGGTVTVANGYARLTHDTSVVDSAAWLLGPDDLLPNHGVLARYRFVQPNVMNAFAAFIIRGSITTTLPASKVLPDKYRPGTGSLAEVNGGGTFGDILRLLHSHPVNLAKTYDGSAEFDGFEMAVENLSGEVDGSTGDWMWIRLEAIDGITRAKFWYEGDPEPATWPYSLTDFTQAAGTSVALTWAHNDSTAGGNASMDINHFTVYELQDSQIPTDKLVYDGTNWRGVRLKAFDGTNWV